MTAGRQRSQSHYLNVCLRSVPTQPTPIHTLLSYLTLIISNSLIICYCRMKRRKPFSSSSATVCLCRWRLPLSFWCGRQGQTARGLRPRFIDNSFSHIMPPPTPHTPLSCSWQNATRLFAKTFVNGVSRPHENSNLGVIFWWNFFSLHWQWEKFGASWTCLLSNQTKDTSRPVSLSHIDGQTKCHVTMYCCIFSFIEWKSNLLDLALLHWPGFFCNI